MKRLIIVILSTLVLCALPAEAKKSRKKQQSAPPKTERTAADITKEKQDNEKAIAQTQKEIKSTNKEIGRQVNRFNSLNGQIASSNSEISILEQSILELDSLSQALTDTIDVLGRDIELLKKNCAKSLRDARTARQNMSVAALIFSSESFYQTLKRLGYIKQVNKWRAQKAEQLRQSIALLDQKREELIEVRKKRAISLNVLNTKRNELQSQAASVNTLVVQLRGQKSSLEKELARRQQLARELNRQLDRIIAEEARKAEEERKAIERAEAEKRARQEEEARRKAQPPTPAPTEQPASNATPSQPASSAQPAAPTPAPAPKNTTSEADLERFKANAEASRVLSGSFEKNKGRLLFPVQGSYNIVGTFGRTQHANLSRIEIENSGIDIETTPGTNARSVFDGTVSSIFFMEGFHNIVMVRHGEYLTVYTNIDRLAVKKGDTVKAGQTLGHIFSDPEDDQRTILHFEVRHEREKLNPLEWIK